MTAAGIAQATDGLKVTHLATQVTGGAGRAALRLHAGLGRLGQHSVVVSTKGANQHDGVIRFRPPMGLFSRIHRALYQHWTDWKRGPVHSDATLFSDERAPHGIGLMRQMPRCDVVHLHWVTGFVDYRGFLPQAARTWPLVWTLHDLNPFTGGCHYDAGCGAFTDACGRCPLLGASKSRDLSRRIWQRKQAVFGRIPRHRLTLVAPSHWLAAKARASSLLGRFPCHVISNGLDTGLFAPQDSDDARGTLGIPRDARVVLFIAASVSDERKGFAFLIEALEKLHDLPGLLVASIGRDVPSVAALDIPHVHLGRIDDDALLSRAYAAADVFTIPSLEDNLPNTVAESMACGTAVAGFAVGGIPEMVEDGVTGRLAPAGNSRALAECIRALIDDDERRKRMGMNARRIAVARYSQDSQAEKLLGVYSQMLSASE